MSIRENIYQVIDLIRPENILASVFDKTGLEETTVRYLSPNLMERTRMPLAAGGLFSTAADLAKMYQMVLNGGSLNGHKFLKSETLKLMTTNQTGDLKVSFSDGMHMGLGFHIVNRPTGVTESLSPGSFGHGGAYGTQAWIDLVLYFLFFFPGILALIYAGYHFAWLSWLMNERSAFSPRGPVVYPFKALIPIAGTLMVLQGIAEVLRCITCIRTGAWPQRLHDVEELERIALEQATARNR